MSRQKALYDSELQEFYKMYYSGKYFVKEIAEWFGISYYSACNYIKRRDEYDTIRVKTTQRKGK